MAKPDSDSKCVKADYLDVVETLLDAYVKEDYVYFFDDKCITCMSSRTPTQIIFKCSGCQLVTYCTTKCQREDWSNHKYVCREFPLVNGRNVLYTTGPWGKHTAGLRERGARLLPSIPDAKYALEIFRTPSVCHNCWETWSENMKYCKCICVSYCSEACSNADIVHKGKCERFHNFLCLSYPLNIFNALHEVSIKLHQGDNDRSIYDMVTLTIHIVDSSPIFDSRAWEEFMRTFPKLKKLKIVFLIEDRGFAEWFGLNYPHIMVNACDVSYSIQQLKYHHFFSSLEYTEPDVVVVFGNKLEMYLDFEEGIDYGIDSEISYRNMLYNPKTILILVDATEELVSNGAKAVNEVQPVVQTVTPPSGKSNQRSCTK